MLFTAGFFLLFGTLFALHSMLRPTLYGRVNGTLETLPCVGMKFRSGPITLGKLSHASTAQPCKTKRYRKATTRHSGSFTSALCPTGSCDLLILESNRIPIKPFIGADIGGGRRASIGDVFHTYRPTSANGRIRSRSKGITKRNRIRRF